MVLYSYHVNDLWKCDVMLGSLILACVQHVIMLIHLQKMLRHDLMCLCNKSTTFLSE